MKIPVTLGLGGRIHKVINRCGIYCKIAVCLSLISDKNEVTGKSSSSSKQNKPHNLSQNKQVQLANSFPINSAYGSCI